MKKLLLLAALFSTLLLARNDVPSCYDALHIDGPKGPADKEIFVVVDQTTILDKKLMIYVYRNTMKFIKNNEAVTIVSFSSNAKGRYTDVTYSGKVEALLPEESKHNTAKKALRKYQGCMNGQHKYAKNKATKALVSVLKGASKSLPRSDIVKSLTDVAKNIVAPSHSKHKVVLLVSDMVEHSSVTSFYSKGHIRKLNIDKEIAKIKKSGYLPDFGGADIYVVGTGMVGKEGYMDAKTLQNLTGFWQSYFAKTNGHLKAMGTPMLLEDIDQ